MCSVPEDFDSIFQLAKSISVFMFQSSSHLCMKTETVLCHLKSLIGHPQGWKIPWKYCNIFIKLGSIVNMVGAVLFWNLITQPVYKNILV